MPDQIQFQAAPMGIAPPPDAAAKIKARAEKFGTSSAPKFSATRPGPLRDELRKERLQKKDIICTGFDLYSEEERAKQNKRASRFGTSVPAAGVAIAKLGPEEQARKNRAMKFGLQYEEAERSGIDPKMIVEPRADASGESQPRPDALHVYGVDLLTTADILSHFNTYGPSYVEWLNDSSCNVCFPDKFTVKRAIVQMGEALTDEEKQQNQSVIGFDESTTPQLWYRSKTAFTKSGVSVPLIFRVATTSDCKNPMKKHKRRNLWKMPLRDALEVAKAHAEGGAADEEMREVGGGGRKSGGKRDRIDDDGDVVMGAAGAKPRRKKQSAARSTAHGSDADADPSQPVHALHDETRTCEGAHSFFSRLRQHEQGALEVAGVDAAGAAAAVDGAVGMGGGVPGLQLEELEWDDAGVVRVKDDPTGVKHEDVPAQFVPSDIKQAHVDDIKLDDTKDIQLVNPKSLETIEDVQMQED